MAAALIPQVIVSGIDVYSLTLCHYAFPFLRRSARRSP
jgi:hypothetical protein